MKESEVLELAEVNVLGMIDIIKSLKVKPNFSELSRIYGLDRLRYEKSSTIITTNKPLSKWGEIFGDSVLANAILDRLLHHSHIINIVGRSYRTKDKIESMESIKR